MIRPTLTAIILTILPASLTACASTKQVVGPNLIAPATLGDWREAERGVLEDHVQLTFSNRFIKAGESYFSPDESQIIFQGIERPAEGDDPEAYYQMYVADLLRDARGRITGIDNVIRLSPPGSSNTCGWFHPTQPNTVIFGSTIVKPKSENRPGYQRGVGRYTWDFPPEMTIVSCDLTKADGRSGTLRPLVVDDDAYLAECVISPDGQWLVYCRRHKDDPMGGDLLLRNLETGHERAIANARGYDGGPFFSPDGTRLCYRSDRRGNNLLQVFVAELSFDDGGTVIGLDREFQITDNEFVNWAPYWHPEGRHLVYTTSVHGHTNYETYIVDADPGNTLSEHSPAKYGTKKRRVTSAEGFDGLPVFNSDGSLMMWTSQRGEDGSSQLWLARFVMAIDDGIAAEESGAPKDARPAEIVHVIDPETGTIYVYDPKSHVVSVYDPVTHQTTEVSDDTELKHVMELFRSRNDGGG